MTRKAAPALASGCSFIVKPAEETQLTTMRLVELAHEAEIPKDAIQCINGKGSIVGKLFLNLTVHYSFLIYPIHITKYRILFSFSY